MTVMPKYYLWHLALYEDEYEQWQYPYYIWSIQRGVALMPCIGMYLSLASGLMSSQDRNIIGHS